MEKNVFLRHAGGEPVQDIIYGADAGPTPADISVQVDAGGKVGVGFHDIKLLEIQGKFYCRSGGGLEGMSISAIRITTT